MIRFKSLTLENYQSIEKVKLNLDSKKVFCVVGKNGSGKSSLFEGLIWVIYGKARTNKFIRHGANYCYGSVELNINEKEVTISRYKNHPDFGNFVKIKINNEELVLHTLREANKKIEELIGSYELFQSCVVLTQGLPYDFTLLNPTLRKVVFEEMIGIAYWDNLREKMKKKLKEFQEKLKNVLTEMSQLERKQQYIQGQLRELENQLELSNLKEDLQFSLKEKKEIESKLSKFGDIDLLVIRDRLSKVEKKLALLEQEYRNKFSILESGVCPTCGQPYPEQLLVSVKDKLAFLKENILQLKQLRQQLESEREIILKKHELLAKYSSLEERIQRIKIALANCKNYSQDKLNKLTQELSSVQEELENLTKKQSELESNIDFISYVIDLLKPSSTFRNNMLSRYVSVLNTILSDFPTEFEIKFTLNKGLDLNITREGNQLEVKQLSGGEKRKVGIVILLALQQLMERVGGIRTNLLVVDEIFDALDFNNLQFAVELFAGFEGEKSVFIITHNELLKEMVSNVVEVEKVGNKSEYSNLPT